MQNSSRYYIVGLWSVLPAFGLAALAQHTALAQQDTALAQQVVSHDGLSPSQRTPWAGPLRFEPCDWDAVLAFARQDPQGRRLLDGIVVKARQLTKRPLTKRVYRLADLPEAKRDGRASILGDSAELFCLAKADLVDTTRMQRDLPLLALAVRATGDEKCLDYLVRQLREMATWHPFQRPGWTLRAPGIKLRPGGDGNWLSTGHGVWGVVEVLSIAGDRLPADLRQDLRKLIQSEIDSILDDWRTKRPFYMKGKGQPQTNHWTAPFSALVYGALYLEDERNRDAYELGVQSLLRTAQTQGDDGSCPEGPEYAHRTTEGVFRAAWATAAVGDRRLAEQPFIVRFKDWYLHTFMPGGYQVNAYDSRRYKIGSTPPLPLVLAMLMSVDGQSTWVVEHLFEGWPEDPLGLVFGCRMTSADVQPVPPKPYGFFPAGRIVTWRSDWNQDSAMGLWVRGATKRDGHVHRDAGHISLYNGSQLVLLDCGRGLYASPLPVPGGAQEAGGHNVLQVGALPRKVHCDAPITVARLDADGGDISVDATEAYEHVSHWTRRVTFSAEGWVELYDSVAFEGEPRPVATECFRFHLGSPTAVEIAGENTEWTVHWPGVSMTLRCDVPIAVDQFQTPDFAGPKEHACLSVRAAQPLSGMCLKTRFVLRRESQTPADGE